MSILSTGGQTALFWHDGADRSDANWVNLEKLKLLPPEAPRDEESEP